MGSVVGVLGSSGTGRNISPNGTQLSIKAPMMAMAPRHPYSVMSALVIGAKRNVPSPEPHTAIPENRHIFNKNS